MSKRLAFLFGFAIVVAHVPFWSQPSLEPKSALLLAAGAMAWCWLGWKGRPLARYPWALLLPIGWLLLSACWSPAPFLGLQRIIWVLAAMGVGTWLAGEEPRFHSFMSGFLTGTGIHAFLILLQWIPPVRAMLPPSLGADPFQGIGRGLFHNTNMAALPLVILIGWLWLSDRDRPWMGHLGWALPALALTQSRLGIGVCSCVAAYAVLHRFSWKEAGLKPWLCAGPPLVLSFAWSLTAHRWGWLLPAGGAFLALPWGPHGTEPARPGNSFRFLPILGLTLAVLAGWATRGPKSASQSVVQGTVIQGDVSLSQRLSYYRAAALAFLDRPLTGQGLGAARPIYPKYVDRNRPAAEIAYGDFQRPNNFHSEPLEWLAEGGLPFVALLLLGLWLDRQGPNRGSRSLLLVPVAGIALMDFPFHNPLGLLWLGITLGLPPSLEPRADVSKTLRLAFSILGVGLLGWAGLQVHAAQERPSVERGYLARQDPSQIHAAARRLWEAYPFSADLFDLFSKSAIQAIMASPDRKALQELDELLRYDPYDHHLLLARAQMARRMGDARTAQTLMIRYSEVAPKDPERYLRLAWDAFQQGKPAAAVQLLEEAKKQPGFNPAQQRRLESMLSQATSRPH